MAVKNKRKTTRSTPKRHGFQKGKSGNPAGRPKGAVGKATAEAKAACALIVDDAVYRTNLIERARKGKLAPAVETMLWYYAKGKPKETVILTDDRRPDLSKLSDAELAALERLVTKAAPTPSEAVH